MSHTSNTLPESTLHGTRNGEDFQIFTLTNSQNMRVQVSELGAHLISVTLPDDSGNPIEMTLGHDSFEGWCNNGPYLGATVGRFGNRIKDGKFSLEGKDYILATNNFPNGIPCHLHGGPKGFHTKKWQGTPLAEDGKQGVRFTLTSPDGDEEYPGKLDVSVTYWLSENNELSWIAEATSDQATPVNIINHTYWNLSGNMDQSIGDHEIQILSDQFLPKDEGMIPTGEFRDVAGTPMDLNTPTLIAKGLSTDYDRITTSKGFDHCWVLRPNPKKETRLCATVRHPETNRIMEVSTDQDGVQFYTGNFLDGTVKGRNGCTFPAQTGFCLETQAFPDAPNHPEFPSCILRPGETYHHKLVFTFR